MRVLRAFPAAVRCARGADFIAACTAICFVTGVAAAREPWPEQAVAGPGFQFEPLAPDPVMPAAPPSYSWPKPPRPQYIEPAPAPQAYVAAPVQTPVPAPVAVPSQTPAPMAAQYQPQTQYQPQLPVQQYQAQAQYQPQYQPQAQYQPQGPSQLQPQGQPPLQYQPQAAAQAPTRPSLAMAQPSQQILPAPSGPNAESVLLPGQEAVPATAYDAIDDGCPGYRLYAIADALFMARYSGIANRPLAFNEDTGATVLSTQALQWGFVPGFRAFFGERKPGGCGWEVGYLGLYGLYSTTQAFGPGNLIAPGDLGLNASQFNSADLMSVNYASTLNMAEANVFWYDCCGGKPCQGACQGGCPTNACQPACGSCRCIDWLAGFRFANLGETANFSSTCCGLTQTSNYGVATTSNLFGGQVGVRGRKDYGHWACEGWLKMGLAGVWMSQTQSPILDFETGLPYRDGSSSNATGLAGFADANASAIYKFNRTWGLRVGVNAIWIGNVALAPNQWDFSQTAAVTTLNTGSLVLLGGNVGVEARW